MKKETLFLVRSDIQMIEVETGMITNLGIIGYKAKWHFPYSVGEV